MAVYFPEKIGRYEELFAKLRTQIDNINNSLSHRSADISVLADSGTPQIQTTWFLLVKSGYLNARLLQGVPPRFAGGSYKLKEINFEKSSLPGITIQEGAEGDESEKQPKEKKKQKEKERTAANLNSLKFCVDKREQFQQPQVHCKVLSLP